MKKNHFLSGITYSLLLSSPLLLSACQGVEGLFTDSPNRSYDNRQSYGNSQHTTTIYQSGVANHHRSSATTATGSADNSNSTSAKASSAASTSAQALGNTPQTSTQAAKKTVGTAVPTEAPTVGQ
ncbi:hypothetical protein [Legionella cardiaca]|uniref:Lipoprotein n=1 Tax=Legionella cardiaca TaxID=1071983 RepID=A0ABY8ATC7_9GAMM|nr:hypothetical protein [Legionella cardiaca]WED43036.1 hypothetical protein PXX05_14230 [Legionella cardiaca]